MASATIRSSTFPKRAAPAELEPEVKNQISHRAHAALKIKEVLQKRIPQWHR